MAVTVADIRTELQLPSSLIPDTSIAYVIEKVGDDLNLCCAEVLRMVVRRYRGKIRMKIGKYEEWIDTNSLRVEIQNYMARSSAMTMDDGFEYQDASFEIDAI